MEHKYQRKTKMAITASINPSSGNIKFKESQKLTAVVDGAPVDATIDYVWKVDGTPVQADAGSNGLSITVQGDKVGTKLASLTVNVTSDGVEPETAEATANVVIAKAEQTPFTATLTVTPETGEVGDTLKAKVVVSEPMDGATISYKWSSGETTSEIDYVADAAGKPVIKCDVTSTLANYVDLKVSRSKTVTITDITSVDNDDFYIWPLPHIDAAFMYGSWWALDEIQAMTKEGKDWKTETVFKYQKEVDTFKKILADYTTVMIQESRNGRIIDRQKLESGLIY